MHLELARAAEALGAGGAVEGQLPRVQPLVGLQVDARLQERWDWKSPLGIP